MKKILSLTLCFATLFSFAVPCFAAEESVQQPVIIDTVFPTDDVVIADIIATESPYNADNTGENDATSAIQKAIDDCFKNGGGTVWLPKGEYRVTGNIYIFTLLRNHW